MLPPTSHVSIKSKRALLQSLAEIWPNKVAFIFLLVAVRSVVVPVVSEEVVACNPSQVAVPEAECIRAGRCLSNPYSCPPSLYGNPLSLLLCRRRGGLRRRLLLLHGWRRSNVAIIYFPRYRRLWSAIAPSQIL
jgi:hypothetical protein